MKNINKAILSTAQAIFIFSALLSPILWFFIWLMLIKTFRGFFTYPWGDLNSYTPALKDLVIYNIIQFVFIAMFFWLAVKIYKFALIKLKWINLNTKNAENTYWKLLKSTTIKSRFRITFLILIGLMCLFLTFSMAEFFCCPGLFPEAPNSYWWLTLPEFLLFGGLGAIYLLRLMLLYGNKP